jgi:TonB family protein
MHSLFFGLTSIFQVFTESSSDKMMSAMNLSTVREDWVGRVVDGRFTLHQWVGGSGHSGVFLTQMPDDPAEKAAIKLIPALGPDESASREAAWAAAKELSHPHLMQPLATGRCQLDGETLDYIVTEYADEVLAEILPLRPLTPGEAKEMLVPVVDALGYLHTKGFVHSRLKPSNILVVNDRLKLSTDGLLTAGASTGSQPALTIYDAPECADGTHTPATDAWALGATLVETLTQRMPDWNRSGSSEPVIPSSIPHPLSEIARGCLQIDAARRWTMDAIGDRLNPGRPKAAAVEPNQGRAEAQSSPKLLLAVVVVAALAVVAIAALVWTQTRQAQPAPTATEQHSSATDQAQTGAQKPSADGNVTSHEAAPDSAVPGDQAATPAASPAATEAPPQPAPQTAAAPTPAAVVEPKAVPAESGPVQKGEVLHQVQPDLLPAAVHSISGKVNVRIRLEVSATGEVTNAAFDSAGPSHYFSNAAMQAARQWKFKPAEVNGHAASSVWLLHYLFTQEGLNVTPTEETP